MLRVIATYSLWLLLYETESENDPVIITNYGQLGSHNLVDLLSWPCQDSTEQKQRQTGKESKHYK